LKRKSRRYVLSPAAIAGSPPEAPAAPAPRLLRPVADGRSEAEVREHYRVERELADRLRSAPEAERRALYGKVYDELFRRLPHHPQLRARSQREARARRSRRVEWHLRLLRPALGPRVAFLEVGAGDCALARAVAGHAERVYALDVSAEVMPADCGPKVKKVLSDGVSIPLPEGSVDLALSSQLMEHLHPRDAEAQLANLYRALAPGGRYFCITSNRLFGPCDVSAHFDDVATGLHLKEYCADELRALLLGAGFRRVRFYAGARGWYARMPYAALRLLEMALGRLPRRLRQRLAGSPPGRALLGLYAEAIK